MDKETPRKIQLFGPKLPVKAQIGYNLGVSIKIAINLVAIYLQYSEFEKFGLGN